MTRSLKQESFLKRQSARKHRGKVVIVQDVTGQLLNRVVWDYDAQAVFVTNADGFKRMMAGEDIDAIGFPRRYVFEDDGRSPLPTSLVGRANVGAPFSLTGPVGWRPGMQCPRSSSFPFSPSSLRHFIAEANQGRADAPPARRL